MNELMKSPIIANALNQQQQSRNFIQHLFILNQCRILQNQS